MTPQSPLDAWLERLESRHPQGSNGIELGLARVAEVRQRLPRDTNAPVILVAGTNGKGSTCAMIDAILTSAGYRVGRYSSPHLLHYNERVRIGGAPVADQALIDAFVEVEAVRGETSLTYFEFGTLAAWSVFAANDLDAIVLEVGLGGRLDATNIFEPACAVVTTIDIDHVQFLGPDRESIGYEKSGIFRSGVPAICGDSQPPLSLLEQARVTAAPLSVIGRDFGFRRLDQQWSFWNGSRQRSGLAFPALRGVNQLANASCAIAALEAVAAKLPVAMKDIRKGMLEVELTGRFQVLPGRPTIVLDVAHNAQSVRALDNNLSDMAFHPATMAVFGMMADKDIDEVISLLKERVTYWLPCSLPGSRAASADFLQARLDALGAKSFGPFENPAAALAYAQEKANEADRILAFGSFLTVAGALEFLGRKA